MKNKKILTTITAVAAATAAATGGFLAFIHEKQGSGFGNLALINIKNSAVTIAQIKNSELKNKLSPESLEKIDEYNKVLNDKNLSDNEKVKKLSESLNDITKEVASLFTND
ncbi:hypothetical protein C4M87_03725, partial [Mycoplasmopsis pullorum]